MSKSSNRVTIFSNGIADFRRVFETTGEKQVVDLPVNKNHIGDILASLMVLGPVTLTIPPSFTHESTAEGKLLLNPDDIFQDIGRKLRGAQVEISAVGIGGLKGVLFGLDSEEVATNGEAVTKYYYQILTSNGLERISQQSIKEVKFLQEQVRSEVDKALQRAFQSIKPQSTNVSLEVKSEKKGTEFFLHYTVPAAAWKMTYRLRDTGDAVLFDGICVVDNNTEEDWNDFLIGVVTGEPITFGTDIAESKIPQRSLIKLVEDRAQGAVEPERGYLGMAASSPKGGRQLTGGVMRTASLQSMTMNESLDFSSTMDSAPAMEADATVREVGDFSIFEFDKPLTIKAGKSAEVPVFNAKLKKAKSILYFNQDNHAERPFRAIKFKNETTQNLGRGVCTVYCNHTYAGSAILPATKKAETALICHALETGVRVRFEPGTHQQEVTKVSIASGVYYTTTEMSRISTYAIKNIKDEKFEFVLDHKNVWQGKDATTTVTLKGSDEKIEPAEFLKNGIRLELVVAPESEQFLVVTERYIQSSKANINADWLGVFVKKDGATLAKNSAVSKVIELQEEFLEICSRLEELDAKFKVISTEQARVGKLVEKDPNNEEWKKDLRETETELRQITRTDKPELEKQARAASKAVDVALKSLACEWHLESKLNTSKQT